MHVWLASYPRSGNSLMGLLLAQCFGIVRETVYAPEDYPHEIELAGENRNGSITVTKTHEVPEDDGPAIYIIRDGRSAVVSYRHFHRDVHGMDISLRDLITAEMGQPLHWSAHYEAWDPMNRPNTLFLRYEKIVADKTAVRDVSEFLGIPPVAPFDAGIEVGRKARPDIFRKGNDAVNIAELRSADLALFDRMHGELMREMGYGQLIRLRDRLRRLIPAPGSYPGWNLSP